jgi:hypothetical protein
MPAPVRTGAPHKLPFSGRKHAANKARCCCNVVSQAPTKASQVSLRGAQSKALTLLLLQLSENFDCCWCHDLRALQSLWLLVSSDALTLAASKLLNGQPALRHRRHQPLCVHAEVSPFCCFTECICFAPLYGFPRTITCRFSFTAEKIGSAHKGEELKDLNCAWKSEQHDFCSYWRSEWKPGALWRQNMVVRQTN